MSAQREGAGAWLPVLTFVLVFFGAVVGSILFQRPDTPARDQVDLAPADVLAVAGWRGPASWAAEGLDLRLTPLHAEPERQAFDAIALAERLDLGPGEPWRLELDLTLADDVPTRVAGLLAALDEDPTALGLVDDAGTAGTCLSLLSAESSARHLAGLFDTRRTLVVSATGASGQLHYWGRSLGPGARLVGPGFELPLTAVEIDRDQLPTFVARLDEAAE